MATTVQQVIDATSQDIRKLLAGTGADATILIDYTNRVQLEMLRYSRWKFLLSAVKSFSTVVGEDQYFVGTGAVPPGQADTLLALTDFDIIKRDSVIDRTNFRRLQRTDEKPLLASLNQNNGRPRLYRHDSATPNTLDIYPAADGIYTIEFRYYKSRPQLTLAGESLTIPDNYKDTVIAGVNWFASVYLKREDEGQRWYGLYQAGLVGMLKDANLFPRAGEFVYPDPTSTTRVVSTGLGLDSGLETSIP